MAESDPRSLALDVLLDVERGAWGDESLAKALDASALQGADRALATLLVYGTLAWQCTLDHTVETFASRPVERLDPCVRIALRLGLFQLGILDRVPAYAAVSTSVDLVRRRTKSAAGFVNALLRRAQREGLVAPPQAPADTRLAVATSHPDWLVAMWRNELGEAETEALLEADNEAAPTVHRALGCQNVEDVVAALAARGIVAARGRFGARALAVAGAAQAAAGLTTLQGEASQLVVEMLDPQPGWRVLDACAAPGGKTAYIAALVGTAGAVVAIDPAPRARERIEAALGAAGIEISQRTAVIGTPHRTAGTGPRVEIRNQDVRVFAAEAAGQPRFDAVLVDAPCSGLGTLRQHPEIRWRRSPADIEQLAERQRSILAGAASLLSPGGRLVYSTCTISQRENEEVVGGFLATHAEFRRDSLAALPPHIAALCDEEGALRTYPHRHGLDGFFAVRLLRRA